MTNNKTLLAELPRGVVRVGDGRGFIIEATDGNRFVVTAAHCLPSLPPAHTMSYTEERTYRRILGDRDSDSDSDGAVTAEVCFVDPIADVAVLQQPDMQALPAHAQAFASFVTEHPAFLLGSVDDVDLLTDEERLTPAWVLTLDGRWAACNVKAYGGPVWIQDAREGIHPGMSGSPVVGPDGCAIGVVATGVRSSRPGTVGRAHGSRIICPLGSSAS